MKRKNLEKAVVLTLLLGCVTVPAWAKGPDIYWHGKANGAGNSQISKIPTGDINGIDVVMDGIEGRWESTDTTEAIIFSGENTYNITGDITIINTVMDENIDNNGALYAKSNAIVKINGNDNEIFIAAIGGNEGRNSSTAISAKTPFSWNFDDMNDVNQVDISGNNVKIIGDLDNSTGFGNNTINLNINSQESLWYGDVVSSLNNKIGISLSNLAEWIYDDNESIYNLELNAGIVNLNDNEIKEKYENIDVNGYNLIDYRSDEQHNTVSIRNLSGTGGIFKVDLDWLENKGTKYTSKYSVPDNSDYIFITNSEENSTQTLDFDVTKANLDKMNIGDKLYFANVKDGNTAFTTVMGDIAEYSAAANVYDYQYGIDSETETNGTATDWYIGLTGKSAEGNANMLKRQKVQCTQAMPLVRNLIP